MAKKKTPRKRNPLGTLIIKRSIVIAGHKTSVSLEDFFWYGFIEIANKRDMILGDLAHTLDANGKPGNLSSKIRVMVGQYYKDQIPKRIKKKKQR